MQNTKHLLSLVRVADVAAVAAEVVEKAAIAARTAGVEDVINQEKKNQCQKLNRLVLIQKNNKLMSLKERRCKYGY